jgi:hypothetical protein
VMYPIEGDGQQTPSCGYVLMSVQDALNDLTDLQMEQAMKAIPASYMDKDLFDIQAYAKQKAGPGAHYPVKNVGEKKVADHVWTETPTDISASTVALYEQMWGPIPQFLSGLFPSVLGATDPANQTKGGILALADASRGYQGPAWRSWQSAYARMAPKMVRIDAYFDEDPDLIDLRQGEFWAVPDSDQNLPITYEEQQRAYQAIVTTAVEGFQPAMQMLMEPENQILGEKFIGIPGWVMPGAKGAQKQLREIQEMLQEPPTPNLDAMQMYQKLSLAAQVVGAPPPPAPPPEKMFNSSIPIDPEIEDNATEGAVGKDWLNSEEGQKAKRENPMGFLNVKIHTLAHLQAADQQGQQQAGKMIMQAGALEAAKAKGKASAEPAKGPSESINFKDLPPTGKLQLAGKAGLLLNPAEVAEQHDADLAQKQNPKPFPVQ